MMRQLQNFLFGTVAVFLMVSQSIAQTCVSNRGASWNWTVPVAQTIYLNGPNGVVARAVNLPYYSTDDDTVNLNLATGADVLPSDGWVLLYRAFGNPSCGVNMPYFILYNRFNGILRLFFHDDVSSDTFSSGKVTLAEVSGGKGTLTAAPLLSFDGGDATHPLITLNKVTPGFWSYADFSLTAFDPSPVKDATLLFEVNGVTTFNLQISGGITLEQVVKTSHVSGTIDPLGAIKAADANYRTYNGIRNDLNSQITNANGTPKNKDKWWYNGVKSLVSGLNLVTGIQTIAGFVTSFLGGGKSQAPPLHFQGQIQVTGTMQSQASLGEIIMRVPGAQHSNLTEDAMPFSDVPLGVFKANIPVVDSYYEYSGCIEITCIVDNGKVYQSETPLSLQFNPNATSGATVYVAWGWTFDTQATSFAPEVRLTGNTVSFNLGGRFTNDPSGVVVKIRTIPASAPLGQDPVLVMKNFPVNINFLGVQ